MQAARGTPVGPSRRRRLTFALVAVAAYAADQVSKLVAVDRLEGRPDVSVVGDLLQLNLVYNPGAAFSAGAGLTPLITVVAIVATFVVLFYARRIGTATWAVALGLLLAGITGNLTDRLLRKPGIGRGHVVDFLELPNWPVFNIADICINVAAGLIIVQAIRGVGLDGSRTDAEDADADTADDAETDADPGTGTVTIEEKAE